VSGVEEILARLQEGNRRFVAGEGRFARRCRPERRLALVGGQRPVAVVLGCADSRVPAELIFDQGLGDLFVVRVAGNVVGPTQLGSVEFAVEALGTRLVVVLGHERCGAVQAALEVHGGAEAPASPHLGEIVARILPAVAQVQHEPASGRLSAAVRANVRRSAAALLDGSPLLRRMQAEEGLQVVGAVYDLATGVVMFLDEADAPPAQSSPAQ